MILISFKTIERKNLFSCTTKKVLLVESILKYSILIKYNFIWLLNLLVFFVCRFVLRSLQGSMFPSEVAKTVRFYKKSEASSEASTISVTWSRDSSNESTVDLRVNGHRKASNAAESRCSLDNIQFPDVLPSNCAINS